MPDHAQPGNGLCAAYKVNATEPVAPTTAIFIMMDVAIAVRNVSGRRAVVEAGRMAEVTGKSCINGRRRARAQWPATTSLLVRRH